MPDNIVSFKLAPLEFAPLRLASLKSASLKFTFFKITLAKMFDRNNSQKPINSFESLTHRDRILEIIKLGKKEASDPDVVTLIDDLQRGNYYQRLLALYSCYGSYNGERVLIAVEDNSRSIRNKAIDLIAVVGSDTQVLTALKIIGNHFSQE